MVMKKLRRNEGFTLMELIVVIGIIVLAAALTVPNIPRWRASAKLNGASRDLANNFQLAKMEATKRNSFCAVTFNITVDGTPFDAIVYSDDGDLQYEPGAGEQILRRVNFSDSIYKTISLDTSQGGGDGVTLADNAGGQPSIAFNSRGLPINDTGTIITTGADSVFIRNDRGGTKTITVSPSGNISIN